MAAYKYTRGYVELVDEAAQDGHGQDPAPGAAGSARRRRKKVGAGGPPLPHLPEEGPDLLDEEVGLFERGEVAAPVELVPSKRDIGVGAASAQARGAGDDSPSGTGKTPVGIDTVTPPKGV